MLLFPVPRSDDGGYSGVEKDFCSFGKRFESLKFYLFDDHVLLVMF
jgi:hypothetical protein